MGKKRGQTQHWRWFVWAGAAVAFLMIQATMRSAGAQPAPVLAAEGANESTQEGEAPAAFEILSINQGVLVDVGQAEITVVLKNSGDQPAEGVSLAIDATAWTAAQQLEIGQLGGWTERVVSIPITLPAIPTSEAVLLNITATFARLSEDGLVVQPPVVDLFQLELIAAADTGSPAVSQTGTQAGTAAINSDPPEWRPFIVPPTVSKFTGSLSLHYPLAVPPGAAGLQPALSFNYSSHGAALAFEGKPQSDPVGWGWQLGGVGEIVQGVEPCLFDPTRICFQSITDANAVQAPRFDLTFDEGSYSLLHQDGPEHNGQVGRYFANGQAALYVELCGGDQPSVHCRAADTADSQPGNGRLDWAGSCPTAAYNPDAAACHQSDLFWIVKTAGNRLYRFGYRADAEQEVLPAHTTAGVIPALRWRLDELRDPFDNVIQFSYTEDARQGVMTTVQRLDQITYTGIDENRIDFVYTSFEEFGQPQNQSRPAVSWQAQQIDTILIWHGSQLFREIDLVHFATRHGCIRQPDGSCQENMQPGRVSQMSWCQGADYWSGAGLDWKAVLLTDIIERIDSDGDGRGDQTLTNRPDASFYYEFRGVDTVQGNGWSYRVCRPFITATFGPLAGQHTGEVWYAWVPRGDGRYDNHVTIQRILPGTPGEPVQRVRFAHEQPIFDPVLDNQFQGYGKVTEYVYNRDSNANADVAIARETQFLTAGYHAYLERAWHGRPAVEKTREWLNGQFVVTGRITYAYRTQVGDQTAPDYFQFQRQAQVVETQVAHFNPATAQSGGQMIYTQYDQWANPTRSILYSNPQGNGEPFTTTIMSYQNRTSGSEWLIGLLTHQQQVDRAGQIISELRYRYDGQSCALENGRLTAGLLTAVDQRHDGEGQGECGYGTVDASSWRTTRYQYGTQGNAFGRPWQQTAEILPNGQVTYTAYRTDDPVRVVRQFTTAEGTLFETAVGYNDAQLPWVQTDFTQPNGAQSRLEYDSFGRVVRVYGPASDSGAATVIQQELSYQLDASPPYVALTTLPQAPHISTTVRRYLNPLGQLIQEVEKRTAAEGPQHALIDYGYSPLGGQRCVSAPQPTTSLAYRSTVVCDQTAGHQTQETDGQGRLLHAQNSQQQETTIIYGERATYQLNDAFQINAAYVDPLGRMVKRDEYFTLAAESFETLSTGWQRFGSGSAGVTSGQTLYIRNNGTADFGYSRPVERSADTEDIGVAFRYQVQPSDTGWVWTHLERGSWGNLSYRAWGILTRPVAGGHEARLLECTGSTCTETPMLRLQPNQWVRVLLRAGSSCENAFSAVVWLEERPQERVEIRRNHCDANWSSAQWNFIFKTRHQAQITYQLDDFSTHEIYRTSFSYDAADRLIGVVDHHNNQLATMTYNMVGQKTAMVDADMGSWTYGYDEMGNLTSQRDAVGQLICYEYDTLSRLREKRYAGREATASCTAPGQYILATYSYAASGGGLGQPEQVAWQPDLAQNFERFTYDALGRLTAHQRTIDGRSYTLRYDAFDLQHRPTVMIDPDGEQIGLTYDGFGVDQLTIDGQPLVQGVVHNVRGQPQQINRAGAPDTTYRYGESVADPTTLHRMTAIEHGSGFNQLTHYQYGYDDRGNIISINESGQPRLTYRYDSLDRLTAQLTDGVQNLAYSYDPLGNIRTVTDHGQTAIYQYNGRSPHAVSATTINGAVSGEFLYDANGNMHERRVAGQPIQQRFDVENRLIEVTTNGQTIRYGYDEQGQRTFADYGTRIIYYPFAQYEEELQLLPDIALTAESDGEIAAGELNLSAGQPYQLTWTAAVAESCSATGAWSGSKPLTGSQSFSGFASGEKRYALTCTNPNGSWTAEVVVRVVAVPPTATALPTVTPQPSPTTLPPSPTAEPSDGAFAEVDGQVIIEAEHYHERQAGPTGHQWESVSQFGGAVNGWAIRALPNSGRNNRLDISGPQVSYRVYFSTPGTYTVYVRGMSENGSTSDDSVLVGVDGALVTNAGNGMGGFKAEFIWRAKHDGIYTTINIPSPGEHTIQLWMREDGVIIDRLWLMQERVGGLHGSTTVEGPAESGRAGGSVVSPPEPPPTAAPTLAPTSLPSPTPTATTVATMRPTATAAATPTATVIPTATIGPFPTPVEPNPLPTSGPPIQPTLPGTYGEEG